MTQYDFNIFFNYMYSSSLMAKRCRLCRAIKLSNGVVQRKEPLNSKTGSGLSVF